MTKKTDQFAAEVVMSELKRYVAAMKTIAATPLYNERLLPHELEAAGDEIVHDSDGVLYNPSSDTESTQLREVVEMARCLLYGNESIRGLRG